MPEIKQPFDVFTDLNGEPLENGYLYIGDPGLDPSSSPLSIYFDSGFTIPAPNPLRTIAGYPSRSGSPARVFIKEADYSLIVRDKNGALVYSAISENGSEPGFFSSRTVTIGAGLDDLDFRYDNFDSATGTLLESRFWINTRQFFKLEIDGSPSGYTVTDDYTVKLDTTSTGGEVVYAQQNAEDGVKSSAIADIATLRITEPSADVERVAVIGYYSDTPGVGGGDWWYDPSDTTSTDDGGTVVVTTGGARWKRSRPSSFMGWSPKEFGARGNGVAGDQTALENWIFQIRCIVDDLYQVEDTLTLRGGSHIVGIGRAGGHGFTGNLGTSYMFEADGDRQFGTFSNIGLYSVTSGGIFRLANGAHLWRLDRILAIAPIGPVIIYDSVWDSEFYNIHIIGGGSASGSAVDQAAIVSKGDSNNNFIYGLRIEQPLNCGIHVAANTDLRIVGGKMDCGFTANQPANGGVNVYGTLRLQDFLFAGFTTYKAEIYDQGTLENQDVIYGGGGSSAHIYWRPKFARVGSTAASFRPIGGRLTMFGGRFDRVNSSITTTTPFAIDAAMDITTYIRRTFLVDSVGSATTFFAPAATYSVNDTDNKYYAMKRGSPRTVISRINVTLSTQQIDTLEPHGLSPADSISVVSAANEYLPLIIDDRTEVRCKLGQEISVSTTGASSFASDKTVIFTDYDEGTNGPAVGKWVVTSDGDSYLIVESTLGNLSVFGDVTAEFVHPVTFNVSTCEYVDASKITGRYHWYVNDTLQNVQAKTVANKGRHSILELFPFKD